MITTILFTILLCGVIGYGLETSGPAVIQKIDWRNRDLPLKVRQKALLEETAAFYNSNNRCTFRLGQCKYYLPEKPWGCAVGRMIPINERIKLIGLGSVEWSFAELPESIRVFGKLFLQELQLLHDAGGNWNENGLTKQGKEKMLSIIKNFELN